jgi:hypothetical protein
MHSGHRLALALNGPVANDPKTDTKSCLNFDMRPLKHRPDGKQVFWSLPVTAEAKRAASYDRPPFRFQQRRPG